ncbi:MAG: hypothetical protein JWM27_84 [Gemmatimonadetes bacterium]|nr:hypothetical protein [Gemmatimonadota bacterium]
MPESLSDCNIGDLVPTATMTLGGKPLTLRMNLAAGVRFREAMGYSLMEGAGQVDERFIAALVWAMGAPSRPGLTTDDVLEELGYGQALRMTPMLIEMMRQFAPDAPPEDDAVPLDPAPPATLPAAQAPN